jgi:hypothetical protein
MCTTGGGGFSTISRRRPRAARLAKRARCGKCVSPSGLARQRRGAVKGDRYNGEEQAGMPARSCWSKAERRGRTTAKYNLPTGMMMNLLEVQARSDRGEAYSQRPWLIVADSLYEAMWLVPEQWTVDAVGIRRAAPPDPGRVIGWMAGSTSSGKAGEPQPARPGAADRREAVRSGQTSAGGRLWREHLSSFSS